MHSLASTALTDTHCHLDFNAFDGDRAAVLERAQEAGVGRILNPGIDLTSSRAGLELAQLHPQVYAAVGMHPNEASSFGSETIDELRKLVYLPDGSMHPKAAAIGEIGLDYYRDRTPREVQRRAFREQLALAAEVNLPVIVHNRQATADILVYLAAWHAELVRAGSPLVDRPGVLHSYSDNLEAALKAINLNFYIGITGPVTFKNARELPQVVAGLPLERLLVETDAPFLAPHPHRGKRNEPAFVRLVVEKIASILLQPFAAIAEVTSNNARRLLNW